ncbi:MAG: hypothetical protein ABIO96_00055 [Nitrospiraceae bacterium]
MSHPDDGQNPWRSLADLLSQKMQVAILASAIEKDGIYTWDRFGRMIKAKKDGSDDLYSNGRALDLLALVYRNAIDAQNAIDAGFGHKAMHDLDQFIEDFDSPLVRFGWPSDECPEFETYKPEHSMPKSISKGSPPDEYGPLGPKERTSLYFIIRALMKIGKIQIEPLEPYKVAESIVPMTSDENEKGGLSVNTVATHLKRIYSST